MMLLPSLKSNAVIASAAWQSSSLKTQSNSGLLRRTLSVLLAMTIGLLSFNPCQAAVKFDGVNDHIKLESLSISAPLTFSFWVNLKSYSSSFPSLISSASGNLTIGTTASQSFYAAGLYFTASPIPLNVWVHRTYIISGGNISLYNNSSFVESRPFGITNFNGFTVGCYHTLAYFADSEIDDVRIYNRPLTTPEIESLYQSRSKRPSGSLANGLVAHFEMDDDGIGEVTAQVKDSSINLNHGQFIGFDNLVSNGFSTDVPTQIGTGTSLKFDGIDDYIISNKNIAINGNPDFSISGWFKFPSDEGSGILGWGNTLASQSAVGFFYGLQAPNTLSIEYAGLNSVFHSTTININAWHYVTYTKRSGDIRSTSKIYIDGADLGPMDASSSTAIPNITNGPVYLGRWANYTPPLSYNTSIMDNIRIYNKELSASEVSYLYNGSGLDPGTSNLQALWTFDEDSALKDSSGNNNHGVGVGGDSLKYAEGILRR